MWIFLSVVIGVFVVMFLADLFNTRIYRPSRSEIADILQTAIDGTISYGSYDEFYCVPIRYDPELDKVRLKFIEIADDPANQITPAGSDVTALLLNDLGREKMSALLKSLIDVAA